MTGYVDGALDPRLRMELEAHLSVCAACREQAAGEESLRARLRTLPAPELPPGLEARIRQAVGPRRRTMRWLLPIAAVLALVAFGARVAPPLVAWELAQDHDECRMVQSLSPSDPSLPPLPRAAAGLELVSATLCRLRLGSVVVHLQYAGEERRISAFVLRRAVLFRDAYVTRVARSAVRLTRAGGSVVGLVGDRPEDLETFEKALSFTAPLRLAAR